MVLKMSGVIHSYMVSLISLIDPSSLIVRCVLSEVASEDILARTIPAPLRPDMDRFMEATSLDTEVSTEVPPYHGRHDFSNF
jgi:hypothetical protein